MKKAPSDKPKHDVPSSEGTTLAGNELVSSKYAKTHFSTLIERTEKGHGFIITRRGKPVARLVPFADFQNESVDVHVAPSAKSHQSNVAAVISTFTHEGHRYR